MIRAERDASKLALILKCEHTNPSLRAEGQRLQESICNGLRNARLGADNVYKNQPASRSVTTQTAQRGEPPVSTTLSEGARDLRAAIARVDHGMYELSVSSTHHQYKHRAELHLKGARGDLDDALELINDLLEESRRGIFSS